MWLRVMFLVFVCALSMPVSSALAQEDAICTQQVQDALAFTDEVCSGIGRNQVCYGNQVLDATPIETAPSFSFEAPGDTADLLLIDTLQLSQLQSPDEWGVALMQIQANLPDSLPDENVVMLMFGDVQIDNAGGESSPILAGIITSNANLRGGPGTDFGIVGAGSTDMAVEVDGRNADSSWFHIKLPEDEETAWIFGDLIEIDGTIDALSVIEADEGVPAGPRFGPMQAFYFRTGVGETRCIGLPRDGILVQTPQGQGEIYLQANEVDIRLGSTAFLRAVPGDTMTVDLLEGQGSVTALGTTVFVPAGARVRIQLDNAGLPAGPPELTVYTENDVTDLPVSNLPDVIEIAAPLAESDLVVRSIEGEWMWVEDFPAIVCSGNGGRVSRDAFGGGEIFQIELTETGIRFTRPSISFSREIPETGPNVYSDVVTQYVEGGGTTTYTTRIAWTFANGGVWTSITDYDLPYCDETFEQQVAFERAN